ncbi:hypothetical protein [Natrialba sp. SSL1]|uniref:hypothetical protein n=1 Tax=Natrialba sp. SSL1 TaxID=1869245 RepID=UPI00111443F0|nr:hypothetical protein [Natrialba sp. SSL1]
MPQSDFLFARLVDVAREINGTARVATEAEPAVESLDRIDRLEHTRRILSEDDSDSSPLAALSTVVGSPVTDHVETIERARTSLEMVTGFYPDRLEAFESIADDVGGVVGTDARDLATALYTLQERLQQRADSAVSDTELLRTATDLLTDKPAIWEEAYPAVETLTVGGISMLTATVEEFISTVATATEGRVDVDLHLRRGTGPKICEQLLACESTDELEEGRTVTRSEPSPAAAVSGVSVPAFEAVAQTREAEARLAMALVSALLDQGVSESDVTVVVRDIDDYEEPLTRGGRRYGVTPTFWTTLRLKRTIPYQLLQSLCDLLQARETDTPVTAETLFSPLEYGWVDPQIDVEKPIPLGESVETNGWPVPVATVRDGIRLAAEESYRIGQWQERLGDLATAAGDTEADDIAGETVSCGSKFDSYLGWLDNVARTPNPTDVRQTLLPVLDAYAVGALPERQAIDDDTKLDVAQSVRAVDRLGAHPDSTQFTVDGRSLHAHDGMVPELADKYEQWLEAGYVDPSWRSVADLFDQLATVVPGRREHPTAHAIDVMEANDVWGLELPYVVSVGLVDGEWPQPPDSVVPAAIRQRLRGLSKPERQLRPRSGWTESRELDFFADTVAAASEALVCTRYRRDTDGVEQSMSPYLRVLPTRTIAPDDTDQLISTGSLPAAIGTAVKQER